MFLRWTLIYSAIVKSKSPTNEMKITNKTFEGRHFDKPLIEIRKNNGARIEHWGIPAVTLTHVEY